MDMTPDRWLNTCAYLRDVFGQQDDQLAGLMAEAVADDLPDISVSADVGRLLMMLTSMTRGLLAIEVGTLAGYSGIWIARGLAAGGRLITIECEDHHADHAQGQFDRAGVADCVEIRRGAGTAVLRDLAAVIEPGSVDVVFFDAEKREYPEYWHHVQPLIAPGGLILADNALGAGEWWIDTPDHPSRTGADALNRLVAGDPDFEAVAVPLRQGMLIGRRKTE